MPNSFPFPTYSGLLEPDHYKKIGSALWLFLWCVSSTTKEVERDGVNWGVVLGNKPMKVKEDIAPIFEVDEKTIRRWIKSLESNEYIRTTRTPHGLIFSVKNSKKYKNRMDKNVLSQNSERTKMSDDMESSDKNVLSRTDKNVRCNKDIISTTNTITNNLDPIDEIANRYSDLRTAQEGHPSYPNAKDYQVIAQIVAHGVPSSRTIELLEQCFKEFEERSPGKKIKAFSYCVDYILDHHESLLAKDQAKEDAKKLAKRRLPEYGDKNNKRSNIKNTPEDDSITGGQVGRIRRKNV